MKDLKDQLKFLMAGLVAALACGPPESVKTDRDLERQAEPGVISRSEPISPQARIQLVKESEELAPALENARKAVAFKAIGLSYEILEDGSVGSCELRWIGGQEQLAKQIPQEIAADLCRAFSKRRYPPGVKVKAEITFGTPHLK